MTRIEHRWYWCPEIGDWVNFQTYTWSARGASMPREPWIIVEIQP